MKQILTSSIIALASLSATAGYTTLTLVDRDGTHTVLPAAGLTFTYEGGVLTAVNAQGTYPFSTANLERMFFSDLSALAELTADVDEPVTVFSIEGAMLGRYSTTAAARSALSAGIYVFQTKNKTYKVAVK